MENPENGPGQPESEDRPAAPPTIEIDGPYVLVRETTDGFSVLAPGDPMDALGLLAKGTAYLQARVTLNVLRSQNAARANARHGLTEGGIALPHLPGGLVRP